MDKDDERGRGGATEAAGGDEGITRGEQALRFVVMAILARLVAAGLPMPDEVHVIRVGRDGVPEEMPVAVSVPPGVVVN